MCAVKNTQQSTLNRTDVLNIWRVSVILSEYTMTLMAASSLTGSCGCYVVPLFIKNNLKMSFIAFDPPKHAYRMSPMMPLSLLSNVEVGEVTEAWWEGMCLTMLLTSPPAGGCRVEHGDVLLLARLDEGEILWKRISAMPLRVFKEVVICWFRHDWCLYVSPDTHIIILFALCLFTLLSF